jgi:hypothetical protein
MINVEAYAQNKKSKGEHFLVSFLIAFSPFQIKKNWTKWHVSCRYSRNPESAYATNSNRNVEVVYPFLRLSDGKLTVF